MKVVVDALGAESGPIKGAQPGATARNRKIARFAPAVCIYWKGFNLRMLTIEW